MGVRQALNEKPGLGVGVGIGILVIAVGLIALQFAGGNSVKASAKAYFTDDEGKTFFADDVDQLPPFDHNGKKAYRADVFRCDQGHEFVGLVFRYTVGGRKEVQDYFVHTKAKDVDGSTRLNIDQRGMEVKRVGAADKTWAANDENYTERLRNQVKCPKDGKLGLLVTP